MYTFKFVKTEFHTGKIAISYFPGTTNLYFPGSAESNFVARTIVDIKDTDEFQVTIPYVSVKPWTESYDLTGRLMVHIVNSLNAPTTVSSTIVMLVELAGGPDFSVASPKNIMMIPMTYATTPIPPALKQSGLFDNDTRIKKFTIGDMVVKPLEPHAERFCIGEAIRSVKQLTGRFTRTIGYATINGASTLNLVTVRPFSTADLS